MIICYLEEAQPEFMEEWWLEDLVLKHSDFIGCPSGAVVRGTVIFYHLQVAQPEFTEEWWSGSAVETVADFEDEEEEQEKECTGRMLTLSA